MQVGFFSEVYKPVINGVVFSMSSFREGLSTLGHKVYIYTTQHPDHVEKDSRIFRTPSVPIKPNFDLGLFTEFGYGTRAVKTLKKLDLYHTHHPFIIGKFAYRESRKYAKPLVFTSHTQYQQYSHYIPFEQDFAKRVIKRTVRNFANKCDCVIAPSSTIKEDLEKQYKIRTRIEVVPNGVNLSLFKKKPRINIRKRLGLKQDQPVLLFTGRLAKEKNLSFLLRMMKKLPETRKAHLLIVGDGPERKSLQRLVKRHQLSSSVTLTGFVPHHELPAFYFAADLFVSGSTTEVHPLTAIEAMAAGCVPVTINSPGFKDTITDGKDGFLTDKKLGDFTSKVDSLLQDSTLRDQFSKAAKKKAKQYSPKHTAKRLVQVYDTLL